MTEEVSHGHIAIRNGAIAKANSQAVDLVTFNAKSDIKAALSLVEEANTALEMLQGCTAKSLCKQLHRPRRSCNSTWEHSQTASLANAGIKYATITIGDVRARAVHGGLCFLRAQALRVGTFANTIPLNSTREDLRESPVRLVQQILLQGEEAIP